MSIISNRSDSYNHSKSPRTRKPVRSRARREVRAQIDAQLEEDRDLQNDIWGSDVDELQELFMDSLSTYP